MNARKRALSLALVCLICVGMLTVGATASEEADEDDEIIETQEDETVIDEIEESSSPDATLLESSSNADDKSEYIIVDTEESSEQENELSNAFNGFHFTDGYEPGMEPVIDYGETDYYGNPSVPIKMDLTELYSYAFEVLDLINEERAAYGLDPVIMDTTLLESAMQRAAETAFGWSHIRQNGTDFTTINSMVRATGENIACFYRTPADAVEGWMNSPGHKANILYTNDVAIGVGVVKVGNSFFWVTDHATVMYEEADRNNYTDIETSRTIYVWDIEYSDGSGNSIDYRVDISITADTLVVGDTANIQVKYVNPLRTDRYDLPASGLIMTSSDESVATVSEDGVVTGVSPGTATITAYYPNHEANATTFEVTVKTQEQADADQIQYAENGNFAITINDVTNLYAEAFARLNAINSVRTQNGLPQLSMDKTLMEEAIATATEQLILDGKTRPNGLALSQSYSNITDDYEWCSGYLSSNAKSEVTSWVKYMENFGTSVLDENNNSIGIGIVSTNTSDGDTCYGVAIFFGASTAQSVVLDSYSNTTGPCVVYAKKGLAASHLTLSLQTTSLTAGSSTFVQGIWEDYAQIPVVVSNITGYSSNSDVAYVDGGTIYAASSGDAVITLVVDEDSDTIASFTITVTEETEHNFEQNIVLSPSCTTEGYTTHVCSGCGYVVTDTEVPALGHAWGEGEITKAATRDEEGVMTYTCARCGTTMTEAIPVVTTLLGDVDLNDHVDMTDVTLLFQYVSGQGGEIYEATADVTGDGIIDLKDVTRLMQFVDGQIDTL